MNNRMRYAWATCVTVVVAVAFGLFGMGVFTGGAPVPPLGDNAPLVVTDRVHEDAGPAAGSGVAGETGERYVEGTLPEDVIVEAADGTQRLANQLVVSAPVADARAMAESAQDLGVSCVGAEVIARDLFEGETQFLLTYEGDATAEEVGLRLMGAGVVSFAEPNYALTLSDMEDGTFEPVEPAAASALSALPDLGASTLSDLPINDEYANLQWQLPAARAFNAWDIAKTEGAVTVVIIDSGVDADHPDLVDNLLLDYAVNTYSDEAGAEAVDDSIGHGTFVTGIVSAVPDNGIGVAGVSYNAKVLPIDATMNNSGSLRNSDIVKAFTYVTNLKKHSEVEELRNISVINLSLGDTSISTTYRLAVESATEAGILVVAAAGNKWGAPVEYPAALDGVIAVTALEEAEDGGVSFAYYSNIGPEVNIAAPGTAVYSTNKGGEYRYWDGTSFATPMVSGAAALLFSMDEEATPQTVEYALEATAVDLGDEGRDDYYGFGALDMGAAALMMSSYEVLGVEEPTCTEPGSYHCFFEGESYYVPIPPRGHLEKEIREVKPTCTEPGNAAGTYCEVCGQVVSGGEPVEALGHDYAVEVDEPTCTEPGMEHGVCTRCGDAYDKPGEDALGHDWSDWETMVEATYTYAGFEVRRCERCGREEDRPLPRLKTDVERFVDRLYENVLGREADEVGEQVQVAEISRVGAAQVAFNFFDSAEFKTRSLTMSAEDQVELVYQTLFAREADEPGLAMWMGYLENGMTVEAVVAGFAESQEFVDLCDSFNVPAGSADYLRTNLLEPRDRNAGVTAFVARLYMIVLGRTGEIDVEGGIDSAGMNAQCQGLMDGISCWRIAYNYFDSEEFANKEYDAEQVVYIAYAALLGRDDAAIEDDVDGRAYWVGRLGGDSYDAASLLDTIQGFCQSNEFEAICRSCGMTSGMR